MITTSRSIPQGMCRAWVKPETWPTFRSMAAILSLWTIAADFFETILIAALWPVTACLASLTRPVAPFPSVFPSCHGPTCVFRLPLLERIDAAETTELRADSAWKSVATDSRWFSLSLEVGVMTAGILSGVFSGSGSSNRRPRCSGLLDFA